jgi:hypothetical protein
MDAREEYGGCAAAKKMVGGGGSVMRTHDWVSFTREEEEGSEKTKRLTGWAEG